MAKTKGVIFNRVLFDWDDIYKVKPLSKQNGTTFDPPRKKINETKNARKNTPLTLPNTNKHRDKNLSAPEQNTRTKKIKLTKQEEKKEEFKNFKEGLGINDKKLLVSFYDKAIEILNNALEDLSNQREKAIKHL